MSIAAGFRDKWAAIATAAGVTGSDALFAKMQQAADDAGLRLARKIEFVALANTIISLRSRVERLEGALNEMAYFDRDSQQWKFACFADHPVPEKVREALAEKETGK